MSPKAQRLLLLCKDENTFLDEPFQLVLLAVSQKPRGVHDKACGPNNQQVDRSCLVRKSIPRMNSTSSARENGEKSKEEAALDKNLYQKKTQMTGLSSHTFEIGLTSRVSRLLMGL